MEISSTENSRDFAVQTIKTLRAFRDSAIITDDDYTYRRDQVIDVLASNEIFGAFALSNESSISKRRRISKSVGCSPVSDYRQSCTTLAKDVKFLSLNSDQDSLTEQIKKHPPPDWNDQDYPSENATKITYNFETKEWNRKDIKVKLDTKPFDKGGLRLVFHLRDTSEPETAFVAKLSIDHRDNKTRLSYFEDVRMQAVAAYFAKKYNSHQPPKLVEFISAYVLELKQREGTPVCGVEKFIKGHYRKYNNNTGWISDDQRNTPASFCHFSWVASKKNLLICDIQGVGDIYTDPQIHSHDGKGYGKGNLGHEGIIDFLESHQCNRICQFLHLPNMAGLPYLNDGTLPPLAVKSQLTQLSMDYDQGRAPIRFYSTPILADPEEKDSVCACSLL